MLFTDTPIVPFLNSLSKLSTQDIGMLQRGLMHEDIGVEDVGDLASLTNEHWSQVLALGGNPGKLSVVKFAAIKVAMRAVPTLHTFDFVGSNVQSLSPSRERKAKGHDTTNVYGDRPAGAKMCHPIVGDVMDKVMTFLQERNCNDNRVMSIVYGLTLQHALEWFMCPQVYELETLARHCRSRMRSSQSWKMVAWEDKFKNFFRNWSRGGYLKKYPYPTGGAWDNVLANARPGSVAALQVSKVARCNPAEIAYSILQDKSDRDLILVLDPLVSSGVWLLPPSPSMLAAAEKSPLASLLQALPPAPSPMAEVDLRTPSVVREETQQMVNEEEEGRQDRARVRKEAEAAATAAGEFALLESGAPKWLRYGLELKLMCSRWTQVDKEHKERLLFGELKKLLLAGDCNTDCRGVRIRAAKGEGAMDEAEALGPFGPAAVATAAAEKAAAEEAAAARAAQAETEPAAEIPSPNATEPYYSNNPSPDVASPDVATELYHSDIPSADAIAALDEMMVEAKNSFEVTLESIKP